MEQLDGVKELKNDMSDQYASVDRDGKTAEASNVETK